MAKILVRLAVLSSPRSGLAFLDPRPSTLDPRPTTHDPRPTTHDPRPTTHDPRPTTHDPRPTTHDPRCPRTRGPPCPRPRALGPRRALVGVARNRWLLGCALGSERISSNPERGCVLGGFLGLFFQYVLLVIRRCSRRLVGLCGSPGVLGLRDGCCECPGRSAFRGSRWRRAG
jgi:hypothetical protein